MKLYKPVAHYIRIWCLDSTPIGVQKWNKDFIPVILHKVHLSSNEVSEFDELSEQVPAFRSQDSEDDDALHQ